jgi:hypothetical protein
LYFTSASMSRSTAWLGGGSMPQGFCGDVAE